MSSSSFWRTGFRWFFAGQLISLLGSSLAPVALAFAVLDASGRPGDLGVVLAVRMLPMLAFLLVGGVVADRFPRRGVLVTANLGSALTQGAVAMLLLSGRYSLPAVAALEFANGVLTAFTTPALRGVLPELVDRNRLREANSVLSSVRNATKILGPSLSGALVAVAGSGPAIAFDAATYLLAAACLARLPVGSRAPGKAGLLRELRTGWAVFRGTRWVWLVTSAFCGLNLVQTGTWQILGPVLGGQAGGAPVWGAVLSARGAGLLAMGMVMYRVRVRRLLRLGLLAGSSGALPLLALGAHLAVPWLVAAAFTGGMGSAVLGISWETSLQQHIPAQALSRVSAYDDLFSYLSNPVGQLSVGPLAAVFGGSTVATVAGICYVLVMVLPLSSSEVRRLPALDREEERGQAVL
ncbi:MFS transporter [Amycolatopsis cynarae]|uniref:MFS transporter n=1 Tax=Amycolatopsis cynarae TaxID=2995223 RepID=A0ABY7B0A4_9PSEU|nr:MFS transporter [Amycolatopsis sp. HUAS 11-8]WAL64642.1 MFS transporter [Amycolatopsis sp. HUAS 11-8]